MEVEAKFNLRAFLEKFQSYAGLVVVYSSTPVRPAGAGVHGDWPAGSNQLPATAGHCYQWTRGYNQGRTIKTNNILANLTYNMDMFSC